MSGEEQADARRGGDPTLFVLLCAINLLNYIDRAAIPALLEPIRRDFGATDAQMSIVGVAFLATYATLPTMFGWLGDRVPRTAVIAASAAFWSLVTGATALVRRVWQLVVMRAAVGVGEASYMANSPSLIMDIFPPAQRGRAMSVFYTASPAGAAVGVAAAGVLAAAFGWRAACLMVGLPGLAVAALVLRQREPVRGQMDVNPPPRSQPSLGATLHALVRNRPFVLFTLAYGGMVFTQNAVEYWLPSVLNRDKAIPLATSSSLYGLMGLAAGIAGPIIGAAIADARKRRDPNAYAHVAAAMALLLTLPVFGIAVSAQKLPLFANVFAEAFIGNATVGIIMVMIVSAVVPEIRSTATAVALTACHAVGDITSIPLVGVLSTALERRSTSEAIWGPLRFFAVGPNEHLAVALSAVVIPGAIVTAILFMVAARASTPSPAVRTAGFRVPVPGSG